MSADITIANAGELEISDYLKDFDHELINDDWYKALSRIKQSDYEGAITASRTLIETVCKHILIESGNKEKIVKDMEIPALIHSTSLIIDLAPNGEHEKVFKRLLGQIIEIIKSVNEIRNKYGDGHSNRILGYSAEYAHALLIVNLSGSISTFLLRQYQNKFNIVPDSHPISVPDFINIVHPDTTHVETIAEFFSGYWKSSFKFPGGLKAKVDYIEIKNVNEWWENHVHQFNIEEFIYNKENEVLTFMKAGVKNKDTRIFNLLKVNKEKTTFTGTENGSIQITYQKL